MDPVLSFLEGIAPFLQLPAPEIERLAAGANEIVQPAGTTIYSEGDAAGSVWVLKSGEIQISRRDEEGAAHATERIYPGGNVRNILPGGFGLSKLPLHRGRFL